MTASEAAKLVAVLLAAFPNARTTPQTSAAYEDMLSDLDYRAANAAVRRLVASCKFLPTIAEIRSACAELEHGTRRAGGEAWGDVLQAVSRFGYYRTPAFDDPVTARCVAALGWQNICLSENQAADRARFIEMYDQVSTTRRRELAMPASVRVLPKGADATSIGDAVTRLLKGKTEPAE